MKAFLQWFREKVAAKPDASVTDLVALGRMREALVISLKISQENPSDVGHLRKAIEQLLYWERWDEAQALLDKGQLEFPEDERLTLLRARFWVQCGEHHKGLNLWREMVKQGGDKAWMRKELAFLLLDVPEIDEAKQIWQEIQGDLAFHEGVSLQCSLLRAQNKRQEALECLEEAFGEHPTDLKIRGMLRFERHAHWRTGRLSEVVLTEWKNELRDALDRESLPSPGLLSMAISLQDQEACRVLLQRKNPRDMRYQLLLAEAWLHHQNGDVEAARAVWQNQILEHHFVPQLRPLFADELQEVTNMPSIRASEIRLFTVIRNERWRLPWFLKFYRNLGVDRFFFVDNDSTDGSLEWLRAAGADVHVFHTSMPYARGRSGVVWINALMERFGQNGWNMYVDVDEAFVFPYMETVGLSGLIAYLEEQGHEAVAGQMVDMFANHPVPTPGPDAEFDFVKHHPLFDAAYQRTPSQRCPYYFTRGGVRRLMGFLENQTKVPLFRAGKGIQLLASSHSVTPCVLSDISCGLLHFKLSGDFANTFRLDVASNNRISACKTRHLAYAKFFSDQGTDFVDFTNPATRTYDGPKSLMDAGILSSSPAFERFASCSTLDAVSHKEVKNISYSEAGNFLWFRVAKTGTRTVHSLLSEHQPDCVYVNWTSRMEHWPKIDQMVRTRAPFCFTFVRNPFDRLVSAWRNKMKPDQIGKRKFFKKLGVDDPETSLLVHRDFGAFVRMLPGSDLFQDVHFAPQSVILSALPEGAFVGRFEHFEEDLMKVMDVLKLPVQPEDIPRRNSTSTGIHYAAYYTPQLVEIVESLYCEDLAKFGYRFERET